MQTWITHTRTPFKTLRELGFWGFLSFQIQMLGTVASFAAAPLVLPLWLMSFGVKLPLYGNLPGTWVIALVAAFIATELLLLTLGAIALKQRRSERRAFFALPMMLIYWPMGVFAAYKAIYELFACPSYWDKTEHGINDSAYQSEIVRLTKAPGSTSNVNLPG